MSYTNYEKGTWTPTLFGSTTAGTTTYTAQTGYYNVVGNLVFLNFYLSGTGATGTGSVRIGNLPFTSASATSLQPISPIFMANNASWTWGASTTRVVIRVPVTSNELVIRCNGSGSASTFLQMANAAFQFQGSILYFKET